MKTATLLTSVLSVAVASLSLTAMAEDPRFSGPGYNNSNNSVPRRTLLGLPLPQQWSGARQAGMNRGSSGQTYVPAGNPANCPNGQCQTGNGPNGQCSTGACASGQFQTRRPSSGQSSIGRCPNGNCANAPNTGNQYLQSGSSGWSPRNSHATPADPNRSFGQLNDADSWTPRSGFNPLNEAFSSRYRRNDFDLKSEYFGGDSRDQNELRAPVQSRSRVNSDEWTHSSRRSMEAPAETFSGVARF